ncbi:DNA-binding GntR family transcriptional regulator [Caldalkalibacillus uzonensis]|uniref:DNA-binding GntR family transcriptional regulator n=1 Tax=Caldalkalibacillus uzonensis TaxID=353224 RepID=A0ABU0CU76_9BACI|nr:GntR family transcriptional regulator [Caldalkalibacillus uzonensis]MDQ0339968.1 DNA-binding GntR family transcriptional regulator [Caldalkalibacillus uzonensis]
MDSEIKVDNRNLSEQIYLYLKNKIVNNVLKPGERIDYNEISKELGVSKTPLRDALHLLQRDGLVEVRSRSGTFVNIPRAKDIEEIFDIRKALEKQAIETAIKRIPKQVLEELLANAETAEKAIDAGDFQTFFASDRHLHKTLVKYSNNQRLIKIMESLEAQIAWIGVIIAKTSERPRQANESHIQIIHALLDGDTKHAQHLMEKHIEEIKQMTLHDFQN